MTCHYGMIKSIRIIDILGTTTPLYCDSMRVSFRVAIEALCCSLFDQDIPYLFVYNYPSISSCSLFRSRVPFFPSFSVLSVFSVLPFLLQVLLLYCSCPSIPSPLHPLRRPETNRATHYSFHLYRTNPARSKHD